MPCTSIGSRLIGVAVVLTLLAATLLSASSSAISRLPAGARGGSSSEAPAVSLAEAAGEGGYDAGVRIRAPPPTPPADPPEATASFMFSARPPGLPQDAPWRPQADVLINMSKPSTGSDAAARLRLPPLPTGIAEAPLGTSVVAVITDPPLWAARVRPMLETWLGPATPTAATLLFFDEAQRANASVLLAEDPTAIALLNASRAEIVFLPEPTAQLRLTSPNGAWKNLAIAAALRQRFVPTDGGGADKPAWFVIVDDDTFILPTNAALHMRAANRHIDRPVYLGHHVLKCADCRTKSKRFWFVYGGNGIFMNAVALERVTRPGHLATCAAKYTVGAGDERLGACFRDAKVSVTPVEGGSEGLLSSMAERPDLFVAPSLFPFAFHRMTRPALTQALWTFVTARAPPDGFVGWGALARWFLAPSADACAVSNANASELCWPAYGTPAEWFPSTFDPKQRALDQYAKSREQARQRGPGARRGTAGGVARRNGPVSRPV